MLHRNQLIDYLATGITDVEDRMLGCEYEVLAVSKETGQSIPFIGEPGIESVLKHLVGCCGWTPKYEGEHPIALSRDGQSITLEPGGQFEMSGAQFKHLSQVDQELQRHLSELRGLSQALSLNFEWCGLNPYQSIDEVNWMPKERYKYMRSYLPTKGDRALYMMGLTCTVQANLDITSAEDFAFKLRMATGIGPLVTAMFANSPIYDGKVTGFLSYRAHIWTRVDPDRCGFQRFVFESDASFADYTDWALQVPMFFVERDGQLRDLAGKVTFADLMGGKVSGCDATMADWKLHLSTLFPEARSRPHLEVRSSDVVPPEAIVSCPALWKGLLYDDDCAMAAWDLVKNFSFTERLDLADNVARRALAVRPPRGAGRIQDLCRELLEIARIGLIRQAAAGLGESGDAAYLNPLQEIVAQGKTYAEQTLEALK